MSISLTETERATLKTAASKAFLNAYAPYSNFRVGASVLTKVGNIFTGCNVENISYGLTICAERNAIAAAISQEGAKMRIRGIAIANDRGIPCSPCGACRQVISEFSDNAIVIFPGERGNTSILIKELLPDKFNF